MRKSTIFILLCISAALFSQEYIVDYVDGIVDVREGNSWYEVLTGDTLSAEDTVRLGEGSVLELSGSRSRFTLSEKGRYILSTLGSGPVDTSGLGSMISHKLKNMVTNQQRGKSAVMGVRASDATEDQPLMWMSSEADEFIQSGKTLLDQENLPKAMNDFKTALEFAQENDEELQTDTARFYIGYIYTMMEKPGPALTYLNKVYPDPSQNYYGELMILKGNLLLDSFAYNTAIEWFEGLNENAVAQETIQTAKVLLGLAFIGAGDNTKAKAAFKSAKAINPINDLGVYAAEQENSL